MRSWWILAAVPLLVACREKKSAKSADDVRAERETAVVLEPCDVKASSAEVVDANGDGKPDATSVSESGRLACRVLDLNFDGTNDRTTFYDASGKIRRIESDYDRDGAVDELAFFEAGELKEQHRATTLNGKLDTWEFFEKGQIVRTERDENGDGFVDQWWEYPARGCPLIHVDTDGDGRPDPGASIDYCKETGFTPPPVPGEEKVVTPADLGESDGRIDETENRVAGENETAPASGGAPPATGSPTTTPSAGGSVQPSTGAQQP